MIAPFSTQTNLLLLPIQRPPRLILRHPRLKEILFFLEIDKFGHPREWVVGAGVEHVQADLLRAAVGDEAQVFLEHRRIQAEYAAGHGVFGVGVFELDTFSENGFDFFLEFIRPELRVF